MRTLKLSEKRKDAQTEGIINYTHFCDEGDVILPQHMNTLSQLFGRIMVVKDTRSELMETLNQIRRSISILDADGKEMILWDTFDEIYQGFKNSN